MTYRHHIRLALLTLSIGCSSSSQYQELSSNKTKESENPVYAYDPGPLVSSSTGRNFAQIFAEIPNPKLLSRKFLGKEREKFHWGHGPSIYRGRLERNQVKVLVIADDNSSEANVFARVGTDKHGRRIQNFLNSLGINKSYLFINPFFYTLKTSYSDYAPIYNPKDKSLNYISQVDSALYQMTQGKKSLLANQRNLLLDHIIDSNKDSLKLILAVGRAGEDSLATYIKSKGGECRPRIIDEKAIQKVAYKAWYFDKGEGFFFPTNREGRNLLLKNSENAQTVRKNIDDFDLQEQLRSRRNSSNVVKGLVLSRKGPMKNGFRSLYQLGADLKNCKGEKVEQSLKGLTGVNKNIYFLSIDKKGGSSHSVQGQWMRSLKLIRSWHQNSENRWELISDFGREAAYLDPSFVLSSEALSLPSRDFSYGSPRIQKTTRSNTLRHEENLSLELGGIYEGAYSKDDISYLQKGSDPPEGFLPRGQKGWELLKESFSNFDTGPGLSWAKLFHGFGNAPRIELDKLSTFMSQSPAYGLTGVYRGRPEQAQILVLADQFSHDDLWVGRALMGLEGQKLQGFLNGLRIKDDYFILRSLPFDTLGLEYDKKLEAMERTEAWRSSVLSSVLGQGNTKLILTLGDLADRAIGHIKTSGIPVISLTEGYAAAYDKISQLNLWSKKGWYFTEDPWPINRGDIPYGLPLWVGTAGDRSLRSFDKVPPNKHYQYRFIAPRWILEKNK